MCKYKLIATDLDGTLIGSDSKLSAENRQAIKELAELGVYVVPTTGRALKEMEDVAELPEIRYVIYSNGAVIYDKLENRTIFAGIDKENARFVFDALQKYDVYILMHKEGRNHSCKIQESELDKYITDPCLKVLLESCVQDENFEESFLSGGIESVSAFFADEADVDKFKAALSSNPQIYAAECWEKNLEIFSIDAGKGTALQTLANMLGIDMKEVISIGDGGNDRQMTSCAGLGLATENACDSLKEIADEIICSNDEHVIRYVKDHYFS